VFVYLAADWSPPAFIAGLIVASSGAF